MSDLLEHVQDGRSLRHSLQTCASRGILTDLHWREFLSKFNQAHPQFLDKLLTQNASLTKAETRLCYLTYLNHTDTQIADITGVNENSVRVNRSRVKKKIGLDKTDELQDYLRSLM